MGIKKQILTIGAAMAGLVSAQQAVQTMVSSSETTVANQSVKDNAKPINRQPVNERTVKQERVFKIIRRMGDMPFTNKNYGVTPKEWGEYLQRTGKQKWSKRA